MRFILPGRRTIWWSWIVRRRVRRVRRGVAGTPLWREAHFEVKMLKNWHSQTTFWSWDAEKLHAVVARSTFSSENVQNTSASEHFLKLRCRKIARRCGEKKMYKTCQARTTFWSSDVEKWHAVVARSTLSSENVQNMSGSDHFLKFRCWKMARRCGETCQARSTFWSWDVEKLHAAVARSAFPSRNVKKLTVSEHFLKLRCWQIARRCGEKHIWKSNCTKYLCFAALFDVQISKK